MPNDVADLGARGSAERRGPHQLAVAAADLQLDRHVVPVGARTVFLAERRAEDDVEPRLQIGNHHPDAALVGPTLRQDLERQRDLAARLAHGSVGILDHLPGRLQERLEPSALDEVPRDKVALRAGVPQRDGGMRGDCGAQQHHGRRGVGVSGELVP